MENKIVRYVVAFVGFLLVWFAVAVIVGAVMAMLFPGQGGRTFMVGIGLDLRNVPGTILGLLAGLHSFRATINWRKKKP